MVNVPLLEPMLQTANWPSTLMARDRIGRGQGEGTARAV
jgi:hypothetical protein